MAACLVLSIGACASRSGTPTSSPGKFSQVLVSIFGFGDARVRAALIDREGRRTGWNVDRPIRQIPGVGNGYGSEVGEPEENARPDTTPVAPADTVPGHPEPTPMYYYLSIQDTAGVGLLREGGCELRLDPEVGGHVTVAVTGTGFRFSQCQDTTSVNVRRGEPSRWWLSWKAGGDKCIVKITSKTPSKGKAAR